MRNKIVAQLVRGFCMGSADVVPGVSGGTIALVFGIYADLVDQVRCGAQMLGRLIKADLAGAREKFSELDLSFLLPLLAGIGLAVITLAGLIQKALNEQPVRTAAVFFGLVVGSIAITARDLGRMDIRRWLALIATAVAAFVVLGLRSGPVSDPSPLFVVAAGAIAICAMILPGISGSFLLLMLGMYDYVIDAVHERDLAIVVIFGIGAVVGLALFSQILGWALERHEPMIMACLIGLMLGSLRVLWPWPSGTHGTDLAGPGADLFIDIEGAEPFVSGSDPVVPILLALVAAAGVVVLAIVARKHDPIGKPDHDPAMATDPRD